MKGELVSVLHMRLPMWAGGPFCVVRSPGLEAMDQGASLLLWEGWQRSNSHTLEGV